MKGEWRKGRGGEDKRGAWAEREVCVCGSDGGGEREWRRGDLRREERRG